ncbi:MAG: DJ-1/PfpI family protein [Candidatus Hydrogenedentes bacterium]|jgi:4-methyl-5(b-hydroxyethyl)-thiazole monophosphate biosynthesis|nr:DJ-1/PfpI family protein [Candidatus Hydrogenedentota bacterium]OQB29003.1 MAG: Chaperone protein YajL [Candidatus Hydrogenedentes bacterium ADurb.Bin179]
MKRVLVPLAAGCEELEAVTLVDILRRGGLQVTTAALKAGPVTASRGVILVADMVLQDAMNGDLFDLVAIPGGMEGSLALMECKPFLAYLRRMAQEGKLVGAICAAPMILGKAGLLDGIRFTAYPGVLETNQFPNATYTGTAVEEDNGITTSRGPGTALDFALALLETLEGKESRNVVEKQLVRS